VTFICLSQCFQFLSVIHHQLGERNSTWSVISVISVIRFTFGSSGQKEAEEEIKQQLAKPLFLYVGSQNVSVTN